MISDSGQFIPMSPQDPYVEFALRFSKMTGEELIEAFNREVGVTAWVGPRGDYLLALANEFDRRGYDYCLIGGRGSLCLASKVVLKDNKIIPTGEGFSLPKRSRDKPSWLSTDD